MVHLLIIVTISFCVTCSLYSPDQTPHRPVVVLTFDDGHESIYVNAFRILSETAPSFPATHFLPTATVGCPNMVTLKQLHEMEDAGWETGGHCSTHVNLPMLTPDSARQQLRSCFNWLSVNGLCHESFAYPSGKYSDTVAKIAAEYFTNLRTSHDHHYLDGINRREIGYFAVTEKHSSADIIARVEEAETEGAPLVVIGFHMVLADTVAVTAKSYYCRESTFRRFITYLKNRELPVTTVRTAMEMLDAD